MSRISLKIEGLQNTVRLLEAVRAGLGVTSVNRILLGGAETFAKSIVRIAPIQTGRLRRSIKAKLGRGKSPSAITFSDVDSIPNLRRDSSGKLIRYPYYVEFGVPSHRIAARPPKLVLRIGDRFVRRVNHPGFRGVKFFQRGVRSAKPLVKQQIETGLRGLVAQGRKRI
jgi:hypothetical protein